MAVWVGNKSPSVPFVNLPLGSFSRAAYIPDGARLLGETLFLLAVGGTTITSQSRRTFD